ncbi:MAG: rod shape-determining protein MreC [Chloroflexi bacterium]|jgi:rod shape-determining protein MreC|nr:rod shape-determining protein MreC [Anaerolineaceae bacterium]NMB90300.1 rod shape-determining protein MreC [Chloroflexota bacterium]
MRSVPSRFWQTAVLVFSIGLILLAISGYLNPIINSALNPVVSAQSWLSTRYLAIYEFLTVPRDIASLRARNAQLENENASLQTQIVQLQQQLRQAEVLYALLDFRRAQPQNEYIAAAVIGVDPSPFLHYIIIDQGSDDGIRHGMPVVTEMGLVGRISAVTAQAATVQLITDPSSIVNARLQTEDVDVQLTGSLTGDVTIELVPQDIILEPGELILTSGLGGSYPADIVIGQIVSVRKRENDLFQSASIQPAVDFSTLQAVLIITNFHPVDIAPLQPTTIP